jgi:hypothetical protein
MKPSSFALMIILMFATSPTQDLLARCDELTATDWPAALERSAATCILPIGVLEKHGPQVREYAVVPPDHFYGQIYEARHQPGTFTGIWWYASYPNHYAGEGGAGIRELGELVTEHRIESLVHALKTVKADTKTLELQKEFFDRVK